MRWSSVGGAGVVKATGEEVDHGLGGGGSGVGEG